MGKAIIQIGEKENNDSGKNIQSESPFLKQVFAMEGKDLGMSEWIGISQDQITQFAEVTSDFQWIHVDPEKAAKLLPEGKTIAHGFLSLSLMPKLLYQLLPLEGSTMALNYGVNQVRFPAPVFSGDQVRLQATLAKVEMDPLKGIKLYINAVMHAAGRDKPVCVAEMITLIKKE
jgi:NADPH:quinone reductase